MKRILLGLGTLTAMVAPIATVVACGASDTKVAKKVEVTTPVVQTPAVDTNAASTPKTVVINYAMDFHDAFQNEDTMSKVNPVVGTILKINFNNHKSTITWSQDNFDAVEAIAKDVKWQQAVVNYVFSLTDNPTDAALIKGAHGLGKTSGDAAVVCVESN